MNAPATWQQREEVGSATGIRVLLWLLGAVGRRPVEAVLWLVSAYYVLTHPEVRRFSRDYLARVGAPTGLGSVLRHVHTFACCSLHRFFFVADRTAGFRMTKYGMEALDTLARAQRGAVILGAHFGSFEALRAGARTTSAARVNVIMDQRHAQRIRAFLNRVAPDDGLRILEISDDLVSLMLTARECIDRGELVAILSDRVGAGQKSVRIPFLGAPAAFPVGAATMAAMLRCPVYLTLGIYRGAGAYDLVCEPIAEEGAVGRRDRDALVRGWIEVYAKRLEAHCRATPHNWFNFYDFWQAD